MPRSSFKENFGLYFAAAATNVVLLHTLVRLIRPFRWKKNHKIIYSISHLSPSSTHTRSLPGWLAVWRMFFEFDFYPNDVKQQTLTMNKTSQQSTRTATAAAAQQNRMFRNELCCFEFFVALQTFMSLCLSLPLNFLLYLNFSLSPHLLCFCFSGELTDSTQQWSAVARTRPFISLIGACEDCKYHFVRAKMNIWQFTDEHVRAMSMLLCVWVRNSIWCRI